MLEVKGEQERLAAIPVQERPGMTKKRREFLHTERADETDFHSFL